MLLVLKEAFLKFVHHWKVLLSDHTYKVSFFVGACLLIGAYIANFLASSYNDTRTYFSVGDLILDNIQTYNMEFFFTWFMYLLMFLTFAYPVFRKPEIIPFALKTFALLIYLRSGFILLTNIGPPIGFYYEGAKVGGHVVSDLLFKNDLFFSGHTAYPFLSFLVYKETKLRWFFLLGSIIEAIAVLLMHVHYSIDVFAAFFITYGLYTVSNNVFNRLNSRFRTKIRLYGWNALQKIKNIGRRKKI